MTKGDQNSLYLLPRAGSGGSYVITVKNKNYNCDYVTEYSKFHINISRSDIL